MYVYQYVPDGARSVDGLSRYTFIIVAEENNG